VTEIAWSECSEGKPVILYRVEGGGHQIAGRPAIMPSLLGRSSSDLSAANAILSAFARADGTK